MRLSLSRHPQNSVIARAGIHKGLGCYKNVSWRINRETYRG
jgi:hypothetical protein